METHKPCDICNGTGEISFFKGVSRFLISQEVCPVCCGAGMVADHDPDEPQPKDRDQADDLQRNGQD